MATVINRDAPYSGLSSLMALKGRMGDTELVHMSKPEVRAMEASGKVTINPDTGLPEAFGLRNILPVALGIAGGAAGSMVGMPFLGAAAGTGLGSLAAGNTPEQSLFNAALSYGAGTVLGNLTASADPSAFAKLPISEEAGANALMAGPHDFSAPAGNLVTTKAIDYQPGIIGDILGKSAVSMPAGTEISPSQVFELTGGRAGTLQPSEYFSKPSTYLPVAGAALTGGLSSALAPSTEAPPPAAAPSTAAPAPRQRLVGGQPIIPPATEQSALSQALGQTPTPNYLSRYSYEPYAEGGIIHREEGGRVFQNSADYPYTSTGNYSPEKLYSSPVVFPEETAIQKAVAQPTTSPVQTSVAKTAETVARILGQQIPAGSSFTSSATTPSFAAQPSPYRQIASQIPSYLPSYYQPQQPSQMSSFMGMAEGGTFEGKVDGKGDGMSDHVQFDVEGKNPDLAMLSRDEYVLPADVVAMIGNGSSNAGADKIDEFVKSIRKHSFGTTKQQKKFQDGNFIEPKFEVGGGYSSGTNPVDVRGVSQPIATSLLNLRGLAGLAAKLSPDDEIGGSVGADWYRGQADLPNELKDLGAPEHVRFGSRGPVVRSAEGYYLTGPNRFSVNYGREEKPRDNDTAKTGHRLMLNWNRQL